MLGGGAPRYDNFNPHFLSLTFETETLWYQDTYSWGFQSSFSEFDLWNKRFAEIQDFLDPLFQSSFSEFDLWNVLPLTWSRMMHIYFNPHFLSLTFETCIMRFVISFGQTISILIFWVWPLKRCKGVAVLICLFLFQSSFSEFDLWNLAGTSRRASGSPEFQSSFSEFDLWNENSHIKSS